MIMKITTSEGVPTADDVARCAVATAKIQLGAWLDKQKAELRATPDFNSDQHLRGEYFAYMRVTEHITNDL